MKQANKTRVIMPHSALSDSNPLFYYYIPFHMRSCLILTCLCFPCHFESTFPWKRTALWWLDAWDFIISALLARPHLNAVAQMKVLKYEQSHGRHLWTAELFTHPVHLINAFMRSERLKSFPVLKTPQSSSISVQFTLWCLIAEHESISYCYLTLSHVLYKSWIMIRLVSGQLAPVRGFCIKGRSHFKFQHLLSSVQTSLELTAKCFSPLHRDLL